MKLTYNTKLIKKACKAAGLVESKKEQKRKKKLTEKKEKKNG